MASNDAGCKPRCTQEQPTTTLSLYVPSAADQQRLANDEAMPLTMVPFVPSPQPINAVPLSAVAPKKAKIAPAVVHAEPPWLRSGLLPHLRLRFDLPVHFIAEKTVTGTDLDGHQNRFRLPSDGVMRNLRPMLSPLERKAASLLNEECPRPPKLPKVPGEKRAKRQGKKHGGLPVLVVEPCAGIRELQLSRWDSSAGTVIKGEGYMNFINNCGFKVGDVVEIWAFKETYFRLFGEDLCHDSPLYLLITKKQCR
ncbi:hypothetical protein QYE76_016090 [Lolium multiflorum]|uniref:TF-B3 domain-containing protein n=1 Tax=Lolium multiflorum TaxID=4521 RepID=A0AAD8PHS2_LOLMU|nr:hypothetical protein QYE76_018040 [Lolium multiflorum]KAK1699393.1 hypothetical protein QYE76_016090 [Lolium multiflorum]